jgi:excisionase family DNA binding protein
MSEESGETDQPDVPEVTYELKSAKEAAGFLRISESTVWRYAAQDILPAYRVGKKRVMFRRGDLEALLSRLRRRKEPMAAKENLRMIPMSEGARAGMDVLVRARALQAEILARRGGVPVSDSWEDINAAREERSSDL